MGSSGIPPPTLQILLSLSGGPRHGYGIKLDVRERTGGEVNLGPGTLYEAIQRMEGDGWIQPTSPAAGEKSDARRQYYRLTEVGEGMLREELARLDAVVRFARGRRLLPETGGTGP